MLVVCLYLLNLYGWIFVVFVVVWVVFFMIGLFLVGVVVEYFDWCWVFFGVVVFMFVVFVLVVV